MSKKREMLRRCLDHYINYLLQKQIENKKRGFPTIIDEDIEKKIEGLNALKETWNLPSEDKKIDMKYYKLLSDSLIIYRQELLKSIDLTQGDVQGLKDPFLETELELKLVEEVRRLYNMELVIFVLLQR
jgi:hypothetical protein